jgi:hypothetical protein
MCIYSAYNVAESGRLDNSKIDDKPVRRLYIAPFDSTCKEGNRMKKSALFALIVTLGLIFKTCHSASVYTITPDSVYKHVAVLADDSLEGREVGEPGEWKAATYIQSIFKSAGLEPKGTDGYLQGFDFIKRIDLGPNNRLTVNGTELKLGDEYEPLKQSASKQFSFDSVIDVGFGITVDTSDGRYDDYEGKQVEGQAVLIARNTPSPEKFPHVEFDRYSTIADKINMAIEHKAAGIFLYTPSDKDDTLAPVIPAYITFKDVPIVFLKRKGLERLKVGLDDPTIVSIRGETQLFKVHDTGYNVIAYLPAKTDTTVIIGAHYDHLGWGTPASLYHGSVKQIHNGADDNASGVSALLELARYFKSEQDQLKYSLLFISFSGEEAGLLGSTHFANHMTIDSSKVRMMINMDMIGRLKDQENGLAILGTGTCEQFKNYFDSLKSDSVKMTFKESGFGPSDHTAFYNKDIPVLYFFTGPHADYHKPTDDVDKIDSHGIVQVADIVRDIITHFDQYDGPLVFEKTKGGAEGRSRPQFSVTLGVMPDYTAEVTGLKIAGVVPDRPGEKAGIKKDDIIVKMGELKIGDIYDYMNALSKFKKGDSIDVVVQRDGKAMTLPVKF